MTHQVSVHASLYDFLSVEGGDSHSEKNRSFNGRSGVLSSQFQERIDNLSGQIPKSVIKFFVGKICDMLSSFCEIVCSFHSFSP